MFVDYYTFRFHDDQPYHQVLEFWGFLTVEEHYALLGKEFVTNHPSDSIWAIPGTL